jgi:hypothetical protein
MEFSSNIISPQFHLRDEIEPLAPIMTVEEWKISLGRQKSQIMVRNHVDDGS